MSEEKARKVKEYLIVTIICEYKILRFGDSDDFGVLIFAISRSRAKFCDFAQPKVKAQL